MLPGESLLKMGSPDTLGMNPCDPQMVAVFGVCSSRHVHGSTLTVTGITTGKEDGSKNASLEVDAVDDASSFKLPPSVINTTEGCNIRVELTYWPQPRHSCASAR
jgi:hypothetical protein